MTSEGRMNRGWITAICRLLERARGERSATTSVEFALILPVLAYLIFGVVDMGMMMFASEELNTAASYAIRQIRTGAVQAAYQQALANGSSNYAGAANCVGNPVTTTIANFAATNTTENCLGFNITSGQSDSTIFGNLLCASVPVGGQSAAGSFFLSCSNFNWYVTTYSCWSGCAGTGSAGPVPNPITSVVLAYTPTGAPAASFASTPGTSAIFVAVVGYNYPFFTSLIGCFFDPGDCAAGQQTKVPLTYYAVLEAEPFG